IAAACLSHCPPTPSVSLAWRLGGLLADPEDHELRRLYRRDAHQDDQAAIVDVVLAHRFAIALDEECLLDGGAHECATAPHAGEEVGDTPGDPLPGGVVIRLEYHPLRSLVNRLLYEDEEASHVHVLPLRVGGEGTGTPHAD